MKTTIAASLILVQIFSFSAHSKNLAPAAAKASVARSTAQAPLTWVALKQELVLMAKKFNDKKLSEDAKVAMLPYSNEVLSDIQDLKLNSAEKADQIRTVVEFIASSIEADFANSNTDTIYFDYKAHKSEYLKQIKSLGTSKRSQILEAFQEWEEFEKESALPESEAGDE